MDNVVAGLLPPLTTWRKKQIPCYNVHNVGFLNKGSICEMSTSKRKCLCIGNKSLLHIIWKYKVWKPCTATKQSN